MRRNLLCSIALGLAATAAATPALAVAPGRVPADSPALVAPATRVARPQRARELDRGAAWQSFKARHGEWTALWNESTGTPHRAFGRGIALPGFAGRPEAVDAAVRAFIATHPETFGAPDGLRSAAVFQAGGRWYARYQQTFRGVPVLFADWEFRVGAGGKLFAFGADARSIPAGTRVTPGIPAALAREAAVAGLAFDRDRDRVAGGDVLYLFPREGETGTEYRLVYDVRVRVIEPPAHWITFVDAANGEVLARIDRVRHAITGTSSGDVHPLLPTDPQTALPFAHLTVSDGSNSTATGAAGAYALPSGGAVTISAALAGPYVNVNRSDAPDAAFSAPAVNPATVDIVWNSGNSHDAERDAFYHVNVAHDHVKAVDPGFTLIDYAMPCAVNIASTCNAFWDGNGVNFYAAGGGCPNTATLADVVYHEYGHGANDWLYIQAGAPLGMTSGTLHEGLADVYAAFIRDNPVIGDGFFGPGTQIRTIDNTRVYPHDRSGDGHITGLIVGGAMWDLRQAIGLAAATQLSHFAKYGTPDDSDPGVAMGEYFIEVLVADDDDADLSNGTPNSAAIIAAFNAHGIGTGRFITIGHTPIADQNSSAPTSVTATAQYAGPFGALDPAAVRLRYQINGGAVQTASMPATGNPDEFSAAIPGQSAALVRYWIESEDMDGGVQFDPPTAPLATHLFIAGPTTTLVDETLEANPGYTIGDPLDDATTGIWVWGDPVGTSIGGVFVQPEDDHTDAGVNCYVTGNAAPGAGAGVNDVDGGRTTLTTTTFDATAGGNQMPLFEYWKWYSNDLGGAPSSDVWRVELSNDAGASWAVVESTLVSTSGWERVVFFIADYVTPTSTMQARFIASDEGNGSLVEAAIDDIRVLDFTGVLAVGPASRGRVLLSSLAPNPFVGSTRFQFTLPAGGHTRIRVFDVNGRLVRTLAEGRFTAGRHDVEWNGLDETGRAAASGVFFVRMDSVFGSGVRRVAHLR
jgi:hypothetical protein